ncbi:aminotransferase class I/II-fold pyridoxal phosphate-dependent enzyme [Eubacteriales bacterium OttesenSCG-928-N13]|nr:aminotransferase class I/II-fold pyridoxal phosphate-dependent enzyme [Eubacteriales bacterium OttesenSCG-928-N13]
MKLSTKLDAYQSGVFTEMSNNKIRLQQMGVDVIDLSTGTPDMPPAPHIMKALSDAASLPENYVYAIKDRPQLLQAATDYYKRRFDVTLDPKTQVCSLMGSQDGLAHLALSIIDPGDTVLVPDPGYPIFQMGPYLAGAQLEYVPQLRENGYIMDLDAVDEDVAHRAKLIIASYPNNPVGVMAPPAFYEKLVAFAKKYDIAVLHDNAYCELAFDGHRPGSFLSTPGAMDVGLEFVSLSKTYSMPGCRVGFALGNAELVGKLALIKSHIDFGTFLPIQIAAEAALNGPQDVVEQTRLIYEGRRNVLYEGLCEIGWQIDKPQATMFVWAKLPEGYTDSLDFCMQLMEKAGVIAIPGISFGQRGEGHVRFGLVQSEERIAQAVRRIGDSGLIKQHA